MPATDPPSPRGWYEAFGRRAFFVLDPERSHRVALSVLALPLPWRRIGHAVADPALATTVAGGPLAHPVGVAGGVGKACQRPPHLGALGVGHVVGGAVTPPPPCGDSPPPD